VGPPIDEGDPSSSRRSASTGRYTLTYVDGSRVNVDAEGKWSASNCLGFMTTVAVFGTP